ncbi:type II toxin-antitoxin system VapC family toxin [Glycomyces arizonensis]|uniref:type II toxin-antitoxin system VapC family toxin n=1 Tax=Glycomyces arizonensis TaxID=256035 RepID=UPI00047AA450|nr:type II toxin-antitoxin system VapC family toxin [Glycomyces arizonensis]
MVVFDTNVISELIRENGDFGVLTWTNRYTFDGLTTAVCLAELKWCVERLPKGRKRSVLEVAVDRLEIEAFRDRILPFDNRATGHYGRIRQIRRQAGRPISPTDAMIAAICASRGAALATGNIKDFEGVGVPLLNPWKGGHTPE